MNTVDTAIASLDGTRLSVAGLLRWLRARGRLGPLVREALAAQLVQEQARRAGLSATAEDRRRLATPGPGLPVAGFGLHPGRVAGSPWAVTHPGLPVG
jgi:hypothetical protein